MRARAPTIGLMSLSSGKQGRNGELIGEVAEAASVDLYEFLTRNGASRFVG